MSEGDDLHRRFDELKHRFDLLQGKMEADMKVLQAEKKQSKAESDSAIERLRTDMERGFSTNANKIMIAMGIGFAFLGLIITVIK